MELDIKLERVRGRYMLLRHLVSFYSPLSIAALWFPIRAATPIAHALAGHNTEVKVSIGISIVYSAAVTVGGGALLRHVLLVGADKPRLGGGR